MFEPDFYEIETDGTRKKIPVRNGLSLQLPADDDELLANLLNLEPGSRILNVGLPAFRYADAVVIPIYAEDDPDVTATAAGSALRQADLSKLPYSDKEFDYVLCRNTLQRTADPASVCKELSRVAKRGFIELPSVSHEFLYGDPASKWLCFRENGTVVFRPKPFVRHPFGHSARKWIHADPSFRQAFRYGGRSLFYLQICWEDDIPAQVESAAIGNLEPSYPTRDAVRECAEWLDCALNCMGHHMPELDDEITTCLKEAENRLPGNKIVYALREIHQNRDKNEPGFYKQLIRNLQNQDLFGLLQKEERSASDTLKASSDTGRMHYPILKRIFDNKVSFPVVSVIIRTYNRERLLSQCLDSLDAQIYPSVEIIIVNDGGRDVSPVLENRKFPCHYIRHGSNRGKAAALNTGLRMAKGQYVNILDDDDILYPDHLALLVLALQNSAYRAAYSDSLMCMLGQDEEQWRPIGKKLVYSQAHDSQLLLRTNYLPVLSVLFERALLDECGYIDERLEVLEDWDFWIRLALKTDFHHVKAVTSEYSQRAHGDNATQESGGEFANALQLIQMKYEKHLREGQPFVTPHLYPKPIRGRLLSVFYWMETPEAATKAIKEFIKLFQEAEWAELVIGHPLKEDSLAALPYGPHQTAFKSVRWVEMVPSDLTDVWYDQFDFVLGGGERDSSRPSSVPSLSLRDAEFEQALSGHPLFGVLYRTHANKPLVSIVILTKNQLSYTKQCVDSLFRHTAVPFELIAVDNGSTDGTRTYFSQLAANSDKVKIVLNVDNKGYGGGNNQGLAQCNGDYIVIMNNDVVVTQDWIRNMLKAMHEDPACGIVGPTSNYVAPPQLIVDPVYAVEKLHDYAAIHQAMHRGQVERTDRVIGFCMLVKKEVIDRIGGFDLRYGIGNFEDDDFCIRAQLAGYKCQIAREVFVHHFGSVTFRHDKDLNYMKIYQENALKFMEKWGLKLREDGTFAGWKMADIRKRFDISLHYCPLIADMSVTSYLQQSALLFEMKKYAECEALLWQCLENNGDSPVIRYNLLVNYMQVKNLEKAGECLEHLDDTMPEVGNLKALWHFWNGRSKEAATMIESLLKRYPKDQPLKATQNYINGKARP